MYRAGVASFGVALGVEVLVAEVDNYARSNHAEVDKVEDKRHDCKRSNGSGVVDPSKDFTQNTADVTQADKAHKKQARALCRACFVRLDNVERPTCAETHHHDDFTNSCNCT